MYFDLEDYRPDTPNLTSPMNWRESVLMTLLFYAVLVIIYLVTPAEWFRATQVTPVVPNPDKQITYMNVEPLRNLPRPPKLDAPASDLDRRASTIEKPKTADNPDPFSRGNTPEKIEGTPPAEQPKGPESPAPVPPADTSAKPPAPQPPTDNGLLDPAPKPVGGHLGESLRNLQQYIKGQNFENPQGGRADTDAAIQFDSKGVDFGPWLRRFEARVKRNWYIPAAAETLRGKVSITFVVHRNGALTELQIVKVSGISSFDLAAFQALKLSNPVEPLPAAYPDDQCFFTVTFFYNEPIR